MSHYQWAFLEGVLPRLAFTGFCFAQPFLVERVLNFMNEPEHVNSANYAYGLIGAYAIVYIGIAVWSIPPLDKILANKSAIDIICCLRAQDIPGYHHGTRELGDTHIQ